MPTAAVNGTTLYYEVSGEGPGVLLVHGLGSSIADWRPQVEALAGRYRVCAVDLRGHGRAAKPTGAYTISLFAADLAALLRVLGWGPVHVVGISLGGMIAFELAAGHLDLVRSLVIVNSGPGLPGGVVAQWLVARQRLLLVRLMGFRRFGALLAERLLPGAEHVQTRQAFAERWASNDPRAYRAAVKALVGWNVTDRLSSLTRPVLVVASDADYTPVAFKRAYVAKLPQAELVVIEDARHAVTMERPAAFNAVLLRFLNSLS